MGKQRKTIRNKRKIRVENYENEIIDNTVVEKRISKAFTREAKLTIVSIFVVTITMISSAYAIFSTVQKQESYNTITVGVLKVDFDTNELGMGNVINLNGAYPSSDEEGQNTDPYSFKIKNTGNLDAYYRIRVVDDQDMINEDGCSENLLDKSKIKVSINRGTPFLLNSIENSIYIVNDGTLAADEVMTFEVRIWIDENAGNEVLGKHYHGKIVVESETKSINKNIKVAYKYSDSTDTLCLTGEETTCQVTRCYEDRSANSCPKGTIFKYKVNEEDIKYFYVLHDDGKIISMQQRENTVDNIAWYLDASDNSKGPLSLFTALEEQTASWLNVNNQNYDLGQTVFYDNEYNSCAPSETGSNCNLNKFSLSKSSVKARIATVQELYNVDCNISSCSNGWINNGSYWTMSASANDDVNAFVVKSNILSLESTNTSTGIGARAVVVINK